MKKSKILPIAPGIYNYVVITFSVTFICFLFKMWILSIIGFLSFIFIFFFFRDPNRKTPTDENIIVAPSDGKILLIEEVFEDQFLHSQAIRIVISLSIFNVHINRSPIDGVVKYKKYKPGKFIPAFKDHFSELNEKNTIGIESIDGMRVLVTQITGFLARRIVCWAKRNSHLELGERFGMIKFGSCCELIIPTNITLKVKTGDKIKALSSIIGVIN